jgi:hypothetical protein
VLVTVLILLANGWLYYVLSTMFKDESPHPTWKTILTLLAVLPQFLSLFISKTLSDAFGIQSLLFYSFASSAISILTYCPLVYFWTKWRQEKRRIPDYLS